MKEKWIEIRKGGDFAKLGISLGVSPVIARLLRNRDVEPDGMELFLRGTLADLADPHLMKDMDAIRDTLLDKIKQGKRIRVIGDYDIDGVCASFILERSLENCWRDLNASPCLVDTVLPHRILDGYGLNRHLIEMAAADGVDTIITCDNGISAREEIAFGKSLGMTMLVTDHHEIPFHLEGEEKVYDLPKDCLILNPKQKDCAYPFKELCGAAVAYRLSQVLYEAVGTGRDREEFLDLAAFATIGDIMLLQGENRIIVKEGLRRLKNTENAGMRALIRACDLEDKEAILPYHVGFILGPCLNAAGRLDTAQLAQDLLKADETTADEIALRLQELNLERREMTDRGVEMAKTYLEGLAKIPGVLILYLPDCHESLAGIIAGRIRETYCRPTIVLTSVEDGVKGSGRSIDEYDMFEHLTQVKHLFSKFGGHKLAAGLSMAASDDAERRLCAERLSKQLNDRSTLSEDAFCQKVKIDMALPFAYINEELIRQLDLIGPVGNGNRKPLFAAKNVTLRERKFMGKNGDVFKAVASDDSGVAFEVICFKPDEEKRGILEREGAVTIAFSPQINEFRGRRSIQLNLETVM